MPASQAGRRRFDPGHPLHNFRPDGATRLVSPQPLGLAQTAMELRCPTCRKRFDRAESAYAPFCSQRCKLLDLGDWLDERFRIAGEPAPATDDVPDRDEIGQD
jgi:endogenous inhibitor of DNA gyrase (YacG/DUF329 family)